MDYFARSYDALRAAPQSGSDTIEKLCERLLNGASIEERKAALLGLKGLSRDWKAEVGTRALPLLLGVLQEDAPEDIETAKAVVETLSLLCEVEEVDGRPVRDDSGLRNTDVVLATPAPLHILLRLLTPTHFYLRFFCLQLLGILLANRSAQVQSHVLTAAGGVGRLVETLDDAREIIRNESLLLIIALTNANADIQKLLAFEGAFDKLFAIVRQEGGIGSGGIVVQDCLAAVGGLLRWNVSNQNYFRETSCIPLLAPLLLFPQPLALTPTSLSAFAFQSWSEQKVINAGLVISLVRMLVGGAGTGRAGNQKALLTSGLTRCLAEMALASNAPAVLKSQSLNALADILRLSQANQDAFASLIVTPLIPPSTASHDQSYGATNGGELDAGSDRWHRGIPESAVLSTIDICVHGDGTPGREGVRVRAAAAGLFESYVAGNSDAQMSLLEQMAAPQPAESDTKERPESPGAIILYAIRSLPSANSPDPFDSYIPYFSSLLLSHLLLHSEQAKILARSIYFAGNDAEAGGPSSENRSTLIAIVVKNLMLAQREQAQSANAGGGPEKGLEWSRVMVGYLIVLSIWLWESPASVKEFLSEGSNLQVLIQPITQSSGVDCVVQGLCAFLLGICYEYNREPGPITRETLYPILQSRVGPDQFVSRIMRLREDPRFRSVGPNVLEMVDTEEVEHLGEEDGLWFDYTFVEFLKTNYVSVQRAILLDPNSMEPGRRSVDSESSETIATLRSTISVLGKNIDELKRSMSSLEVDREEERTAFRTEVSSLTEQLIALRDELSATRTEAVELRTESIELKEEQKNLLIIGEAQRDELSAVRTEKNDLEKEQEDLLVLLEELSAKRRTDKAKLRAAQLEVSEDEEEDDEE